MKKTLTTIAFALLGAIGFALLPAAAISSTPAAADPHAAHGHAAHGDGQQRMKEVATPAEIVSVAEDGTSIEIDHPPIPELGWPAMQMSLALEKPVLAEGLAEGDKVSVVIRQLSPTQYVITALKKE